ncbi:spermidine synthase, partial [Streptomyces sp. NPDC127044]
HGAAGRRPPPSRAGGGDPCFGAGPDGTAGASSAPRDWGFILASATGTPLRLDPHGPRLRTLTQPSLAADAYAAWRTRVPGLAPSTLVHPRYAD